MAADGARVSNERDLAIEGLADLACPMHAVLSRHVGAASAAGPGAAMLRLAARRFVEAVRRGVRAAVQHDGPAAPGAEIVEASVASGIAGVVASYRAGGARPGGRLTAIQGLAVADASRRAGGLAEAVAARAARRLGEVRDRLAPLFKFVDGAHAAFHGPSPVPFGALARASLLAAAAGGAVLTLSGGALAGPTRAEVAASRSGVSVDDLFSMSFGGMVKPVPVPGGNGTTARPAPTAPQALRDAEPTNEFRTLAESVLRVRGIGGRDPYVEFAKLKADSRICASRMTPGMDCRVVRHGLAVDMTRARFEVLSTEGRTMAVEEPGRTLQVVDPGAFAEAMRSRSLADAAPRGVESVRVTTPGGVTYFEPSTSFLAVAQAVAEMRGTGGRDAAGAVASLTGKARSCAVGAPAGADCAVEADGMRLDMRAGRFTLGDDAISPVTIVSETPGDGFRVVEPARLAKLMLAHSERASAMRDDDVPAPQAVGRAGR